jgi:hypothetical protein
LPPVCKIPKLQTAFHLWPYELPVRQSKPNTTHRIAPIYFHYYLAGHDSSFIFDYIFRLLATEDRSFQFSVGDSNSLLLPAQVKRGYAQTAFSEIVEMLKLHLANAANLESSGWEDCLPAQKMYSYYPRNFIHNDYDCFNNI